MILPRRPLRPELVAAEVLNVFHEVRTHLVGGGWVRLRPALAMMVRARPGFFTGVMGLSPEL